MLISICISNELSTSSVFVPHFVCFTAPPGIIWVVSPMYRFSVFSPFCSQYRSRKLNSIQDKWIGWNGRQWSGMQIGMFQLGCFCAIATNTNTVEELWQWAWQNGPSRGLVDDRPSGCTEKQARLFSTATHPQRDDCAHRAKGIGACHDKCSSPIASALNRRKGQMKM